MMDFKLIKEKVFNHRKELNTIAEEGLKEFKTSKYIKNYLDNIGQSYEECLQTGIVGIIKGNNPKKNIAFRADIDGLKTTDGVKHLCGHDGHMSILLGLIEMILENKEKLNDNIIFIFQPAEEGPGGAQPIIESKVLDKYEIDEIYGLHIYPEVEQGKIGVKSGYIMAQGGELNIDIKAKSAHGAMPQNGVDGILVASNLVQNLHTIISRNINPIEEGVITVGKISGGSIRNIIAEDLRLEGTIRAFEPNVYNTIKQRIREIAKGIEISYNCEINVEIIDFYPAVNNDKNLYEEFYEVLKEDIEIIKPQMTSEDFSYYQKQIPGLFFMLGSNNKEKGYTNGLHNTNFNFDEEILLKGIEIYIKLLTHKGSIK